jgi:hypothetical protein
MNSDTFRALKDALFYDGIEQASILHPLNTSTN